MIAADGSPVTVYVDKSYNVVGTEAAEDDPPWAP
jgi:hypothetical protein